MVPAHLRQPGGTATGVSQDRREEKPAKESKQSRPRERATGSSPQRKKDHQPVREEKERVRRVSPVTMSASLGFDPANDNYQGQLTQELLQEHDRQNGIDEEVIERMLIRSTHSPRRTEGQEHGNTAMKQGTKGDRVVSKKPQYPGFKGSEGVQSSLEEPEIRISLEKLPAVTVTDSDNDKRSGFTSLQSPFDMDTTEYLNPPENLKVPLQGMRPELQSGQKSSTGLTVKDLLAPLADRIMYSPASKRALTYGQEGISPASSNITSGTLSSDTDIGGGEAESGGEGDSTLVEDQPDKSTVGETKLSATEDADVSRYSVSDYFKKYKAGASFQTSILTQPKSSQSEVSKPKPDTRDRSHGLPSFDQSHQDVSKVSIPTVNDMTGQTSFTTVTSVGSVPKPGQPGATQHSPQDHLYRGTELDTSLSTIQEAESNSVLSGSTVTSVSSLATVDEQDFKDGLAKLDANIARIQYSLKTQIGGYFK